MFPGGMSDVVSDVASAVQHQGHSVVLPRLLICLQNTNGAYKTHVPKAAQRCT
jgi:hypothetical protein